MSGEVTFNVSQGASPRQLVSLVKQLETAIASETQMVITGAADWGDYKKRIGRIDGLKVALELIQETMGED